MARQVLGCHAQNSIEHHPGIGVEEFEEARIEDDARGIAIAPGNGQLSAESERSHVPIPAMSRGTLGCRRKADNRQRRPFALTLRLCFGFGLRGSGHSSTSCESNSTSVERRRLRMASGGATGVCGASSSSSISQCNSSSAITQRLGAKRASENGRENSSSD